MTANQTSVLERCLYELAREHNQIIMAAPLSVAFGEPVATIQAVLDRMERRFELEQVAPGAYRAVK